MQDQEVTFVIASGGGSVEPASRDDRREWSRQRDLDPGRTAGAQELKARTIKGGDGELLEVSFTATALAGSGSVLAGVSGDDQIGPVNSALADSLVVKATDALGNPVANVEVTWSVSGGGSISPVTVLTGADGLAAAERVLGPTAGAQSAQATVEGFTGSPVEFSHTAAPANPTALVLVRGDDQSAPGRVRACPRAWWCGWRTRTATASAAGRSAWLPSSGSGSVSPVDRPTTDPNGLAEHRAGPCRPRSRQHTVERGVLRAPPSGIHGDRHRGYAHDHRAGRAATIRAPPPAPTSPIRCVVRVTDANNNPVAERGGGLGRAGRRVGVGGEHADRRAGLAQVTRTLGLAPVPIHDARPR